MKLFSKLSGLCIGAINSLLGAGGGLLAVPVLKKQGLSQQQAQASSVFIIFPLTLLSTLLYLKSGYFSPADAFIFLPGGIAGAVAGGILLKKIPSTLLKITFSLFMIYAGVRMILK